ncbi:MAG: hypothetical protein EGR97_00555 [Clostridiales bacterium]|nr:hypothetical protein [Clostridiales bacterium]
MGLTVQGYHRPTYDEILATKIQKAKDLFGENIETDEKTPLGKFIRIGAYDLAKAYEDIENVYYARFPNSATGTSLDRLCVFAGITRNPATQAIHKIKVYGEAETVIGIGELVVSSGEITFYSANEYTIPTSGSIEVEVECTEAGEIGNVKSITEIVNPTAEISHIEYIGISEAGEDEEPDVELRKRFSAAVEGAGSSNINAIRAALLRVPTVTSVGIIVNDTDATKDGRPARSFECYVYGGVGYEQDIAEAIFDKCPIGIKTCSTSENPVTVTLNDDGGHEHTIYFSHTETVTVYVSMKIVTDAKFEGDEGVKQVKNAITTYIDSLRVGADVVLSTLYGHIHSVVGVVEVKELKLSTNGTTYNAANINIGEYQVADTDASKVGVTKE